MPQASRMASKLPTVAMIVPTVVVAPASHDVRRLEMSRRLRRAIERSTLADVLRAEFGQYKEPKTL